MGSAAHSYVVVHQCKRPDVATMDHRMGDRLDTRPIVNRVCLTCLTHWYGDAEMAVFEFPRRVWDAWMESGLMSRVSGQGTEAGRDDG